MPDLSLMLARALHFWAVATMFGGAGLLALTRRPVPLAAITVLRTATVLAALSGGAWFVLVFVGVTGDAASLLDPESWSAFSTAPFGPPWELRLILLTVGCALAVGRRPYRYGLLGLCLILDQAWLGHAATGAGAPLVAYWCHVGTGFAWIGGLVMVCTLALAERGLHEDMLAPFSSFGIAGVAILIASGLWNASFRLRAAGDLVETRYGLILLAKLGLLAAMIGLAAFNRRGPAPGRPTLAASVILETVLGLTVLAAAAALGVTAPPG